MPQRQQGLFDQPSFNVTDDLKKAIHKAAKNCGMSREQVLDHMNELASRYGLNIAGGGGKRLSLETLEKWLNPQECNRIPPVKALPIFCAVVGDYSPISILARPLGLEIINEKESRLLRWARLYRKAQAAKKQMKELEPHIDD